VEHVDAAREFARRIGVAKREGLLGVELLEGAVRSGLNRLAPRAVVVPLILRVAAAFEIDPLHLGAIFLINLELGYLTPPVGMNLFLSSYRFNTPLSRVARAALPFIVVQAAAVLLVTFAPWLSVGFARWFAQ